MIELQLMVKGPDGKDGDQAFRSPDLCSEKLLENRRFRVATGETLFLVRRLGSRAEDCIDRQGGYG